MHALLLLLLAQDATVVVALEDGSLFSARTSLSSVVITTEFGEQKIPLAELRQLRRAGAATFRAATSKVVVEGTLAAADLTFETAFGRLTVSPKDLRSLAPGGRASVLCDDNTLALWSFEDMRGDSVIDVVSGRTMTVRDVEVAAGEGGAPVLKRRTEGAHGEAPWPGETEFTKDAFTLEARFKMGRITKSYATIIAKNEAGNMYKRDFWLLVQNNGMVYFDSGSQGGQNFVSQTAPNLVKPDDWTYLAVVREAAAITYYVNGKQVNVDKRGVTFATSDGPVFLGPGQSGAPHFSCPEFFQFARISRCARTAEEIAETQSAFESGAGILWRGRTAGFSVRGGGFIAASSTRLAGRVFKTAWGKLTLDERARGRIQLFRFRESDFKKLDEDVAALIASLGSESIEERDAAKQKLIEIGEPALPRLRAARKLGDAEARARVEEILKRLEATGVAQRAPSDVLMIGRTLIHGWLDGDAVDVETRFGRFSVDLRKIAVLNLGDADADTAAPLVRLESNEQLQVGAGSGSLELDTGHGALTVPLRDVSSLSYDEGSKLWSVRTDKLRAVCSIGSKSVAIETPAGSLVVPLSAVKEITRPAAPPK